MTSAQGACGAVAHLPRDFCPACGSTDLARLEVSGQGVISAVTRIDRAPSPELQALAPYTLCLV